MKNVKFICAQPDHKYYVWQVHLWLESLKNINQSENAIVLIFVQKSKDTDDKWQEVIKLYPETEFKFYKDEHDVEFYLRIYIPILRPYVLSRYFKDNPEMSKKTFFYCDSDILFLPNFVLSSELLEDDVCYLSDTNSYINVSYFDSKIKDVIPSKLEEYKKLDIFSQIGSLIGITREQGELNKNNSGGAQYLLKNVDYKFWEKVMKDCITIRLYLQKINREFFENENKGFQSWCSDMWAVLWNLWLIQKETKVVKELDFAWSSDPISKLERCTILHNSGIVSDYDGNQVPQFYKGKYHLGMSPFKDPHLDLILNDEKAKLKCNWYYTNELKKLLIKYNLNY